MKSTINPLAHSLARNITRAQNDPLRPCYHFTPPANWMNDPNGTIFHHGEYHLFYQFNPARPRWGNLHWGHAKSRDLIHWEHLPIALTPDGFPGEVHCWSGCCVVGDDGTPMIFYTSMDLKSLLKRAKRYSQQWMATGSRDLVTWQKSPANPILRESIHGDQTVQQWRDPYVWKEGDQWLMVLAGEYPGERLGRVFLYRSQNLINWEYVSVLAGDPLSRGCGWECPNYFRLGDQYLLVVSPYGPVIYALGHFDGRQHDAEAWYTFDHGKAFYATNTYLDEQGRTIIVGWVKTKGDGWAGCLSLPRELKLLNGNRLSITPIPELEKLRTGHQSFVCSLETLTETADLAPLFGEQMEIKARFAMQQAECFGFKLFDDKTEYNIAFYPSSGTLQVLDAGAELQFVKRGQPIELHIFIDHSIIEIFINARETFTVVFCPELADGQHLKISLFVSQGKGNLSIDAWKLKNAPVSGEI